MPTLHSLTVGGAEVLAAGLARRLKAKYDFRFICFDELARWAGSSAGGNFRDVLDRRRGWIRAARGWPAAAGRSRRIFCSSSIHAVFVCFDGPAAAPQTAGFVHGAWPLVSRFSAAEADRVQSDHVETARPSDGRRRIGPDGLIRNEGIPALRIEVINSGVCIARPRTAGERRGGASGVGTRRNGFCHSASGAIGRAERPSHGACAVKQLVDGRPDVRLVLVGEGPTREAIEAKTEQLQLRPYIRLLGLRHDVPKMLAAADLFLLTSISEGIPLTVIEAMAAGLAVVSTNIGGVPKLSSKVRRGCSRPPGTRPG